MELRLRRMAENESLAREMNERRRARAADVWAHLHSYPFYCECAEAECDEMLSLSEAEYEHARSHATWFVVASGHARAEIETVVEQSERFEIVEMRGDAARLAQHWNARTRSEPTR
jgi:hypothetical protein